MHYDFMFNRSLSHPHDRLQLLLFKTFTIDELDINKLVGLYDGKGIIFIGFF